ncbi:hypothetical protein [Rubrivivax rivuli]|uniref:Uncharacterized protein n=1 Tax=Rubrivivax rivuli TaxID=1862385 RepID=A0A437RAK3_9BURK|nr:hypothetical protein [Rubrivivax rivuli]RVU43836.1 hypothetical protein EOE66_19435 [Rubrivivax rivuli]
MRATAQRMLSLPIPMRRRWPPAFIEAGAPTDDDFGTLLHSSIARLMEIRTHQAVLVEDTGHTYLSEQDADGQASRTLRHLQQAAAIANSIACDPRRAEGADVPRRVPREDRARQPLCVCIDGFSLHAAARVVRHDRKRLKQLCRCIG